ncbi:MFS transporter, NNP family, nitrate/nitrite transporter [Streptomyces sp. WMMB 714]|uniref:MFS transporter n=1 Tax=Streptomyces sp. WMMB 714 TaxID=1286822 RepID=UPI0005F7D5CC|nr:MFS transporter [Streptomyces sp. WMMB 714]SCK11440.1 MFS transporter, NNP family, nitrate/nitrite transporter [Streptomyces sp. WMMB 714]
MRLTSTSAEGSAQVSAQPARMLALATAGFTIAFWAWTLLAPLGSALAEELGLSSFQQSLVVAVPVVVGSLGRIPVGALTDRVGAHRMFPAVSALTILPVLYLGHLADSFAGFLAGGFFLGLGGTTFAIGVPFVNAWYPPQRRGLALGIFGVGTGGTAVAAFSTVQLADAVSRSFPFDLAAAALAVYAVAAAFLLRDPEGRTTPQGSLVSRTAATMRMGVTWQLAFLYAVAFGGFVAFNVYLPTYLADAHGLGESDAAMRTAGFVLLAVAARPFGGWLSDRIGAVPVLLCVFALVTALAAVCAAEPALIPLGTVAFLGLAAALGAGAGAVFALVARLVEPGKVGAVTGIVGAAGGLGGFFPPLVMGLVKGVTGEFTWGFVLLAATSAAAAAFTATTVRKRVRAAGDAA